MSAMMISSADDHRRMRVAGAAGKPHSADRSHLSHLRVDPGDAAGHSRDEVRICAPAAMLRAERV
jgi:hypothetical protein